VAAATAAALRAAADCFEAAAAERTGPYSGASPDQLAAIAAAVEPFPEDGQELVTVLDGLGRLAVRHAVDPAHPACAAHLHCQPLAAAVAPTRWPARPTRRWTHGTRRRSPPTWSDG
jgi:L-2,4-diaminobutyrate decarboxylase